MLKAFCKWYLSKTTKEPNTACFCPKCGVNLTVNESYQYSYDGQVEYKCRNCFKHSKWLFDAPAPILLSGESDAKES